MLPSCSTLHARLHRYPYDLLSQVIQTASATRFIHRGADGALDAVDRMESSRFSLTKTFMADMLGVRRPAVSKTAAALMKAGLVRYSRGQVEILDRPALEGLARGCYRNTDDLYRSP